MSGDLGSLRAALDGVVIGPDDPGYDEARTMWNADVDRRPVAIARCASAADASAAIAFARGAGWEITVRCGAHSTVGAAVADGALMIDLRDLDGVVVDRYARTVRVGGGATLAQMDAATAPYGLATVGGTVSHTGVGGLTLGGGIGWLTRKFGLAVDNLLSVQIVTADGDVLRAAADEHPDLYWAVRGGGGNFGVVTEFEFRLQELDPMVQLGLFFWTLDDGAEALRLARRVIHDLPPDLNAMVAAINARPAPFVPEPLHFAPGYVLILVGFDGSARHAEFVERVRAELPPAFELVTPMPYVALQQMIDGASAFGFGRYEKGTYLEDLSDDAIAVFTERLPHKTSPLTRVIIMLLDGAYSEVDEDATAFGGGRSPRLGVFMIGAVPDVAMLPPERDWVRSLWTALQPHAMGEGAYVNGGMSPQEHDRIRATYGPKYARLAEVKAAYDPQNVFHHNINISPRG